MTESNVQPFEFRGNPVTTVTAKYLGCTPLDLEAGA